MSATVNYITVWAWIFAALPGLWLWSTNWREARLDVKAASTIVPRNGRYLWAKFSVFLTSTFVVIEAVFVAVGAGALVHPTPPEVIAAESAVSDIGLTISRAITLIGLVGSSIVISLLAYRWRQVNAEIVRAARSKQTSSSNPELPPQT